MGWRWILLRTHVEGNTKKKHILWFEDETITFEIVSEEHKKCELGKIGEAMGIKSSECN